MTPFKAVLSVITAAHLLYMVAAELKMLSESRNYTVNPDRTVVLPCVVQDQGSMKAIWENLKDGSNISVNSEILSQEKNKYTIERPQDNTHFTWDLRINNVVDGDQGYYQCYIQESPEVSVTHYVIVEGADEVPTPTNGSANLNVTSCCIDANVSSSCLPVCHLNSMPTDLNVLTACASDINKVLKCGTDGKNHVGCCKRRGVQDICLDFCYGVVPSNLDTQHLTCLSQLPDLLTCLEEGNMLLPGPPVAVSVVQSVSDDQKSLLVTWRPPLQNPDLVTGYKVLYKLTSETHYKSVFQVSSFPLDHAIINSYMSPTETTVEEILQSPIKRMVSVRGILRKSSQVIESPNSKRRELTIESMEGSSRVVCKLWGDHADKCLPDIDEIVTICNVEVATFKDVISLNSTLLTSLKESHEDNPNPIQGEVEGIDFREDFSYIIIRNESCSQSTTYKIRTQALQEIFPGSKYREEIHVQGTAHGMTIIELTKINPAKKSKLE